VPALNALAISLSQAKTTVTIPTGIATGAYYIVAVSDTSGAVAETNETNSTKSTAITVL
jgi:hypothetical protein